MKNNLIIIGAGGQGKVCADIALRIGNWQHVFFLDDNTCITSSMGIKVIGTTAEIPELIGSNDFFVGIGDNLIRENIYKQLQRLGVSVPVLIHPKAVIGSMVEIGSGSVVMAGAIVNCCSKIGVGCIINTGSTVDHDNIIEDFVHISPGVHTAGVVKIGERCVIGIGASVSNGITIAKNCIVGAGAVVVKSLTDAGTYIGVPAKKMQ